MMKSIRFYTSLLGVASFRVVGAFQPSRARAPTSSIAITRRYSDVSVHIRDQRTSKLGLFPEIQDIAQQHPSLVSSAPLPTFLLAESEESWRQYVPLVVSVAVIIDILLGNPLANMALAPMKRASEKGATGDSDDNTTSVGGGRSLFSAMGGGSAVDKSKERVDTEAIAQAALDKARNTLELRNFLEENKTNEQRYEEMRKKIDRQMDEFE
jgi:hypothetical protein